MSVATMAKLAEGDATPPANTMNLISAYIPSEAIAVYIGALGILVPTAEATASEVGRIRLVCFALGVLVAVVIAIGNVNPAKVTGAAELWRRRLVVAALAGVAFSVYAAATPSFFFQDTYLTIAFTQWAAIAALVCAIVLPPLAKFLGVREVKA